MAKVESWRQRAQEWLDAAADGPLRAWVKPAVLALTATVGVVGLLHLLLAALIAAGPVSRWIGAGVVGVLALVSLGIVLRNVVISLADPGQRRLFLLALLASAAAILLGIEAFAAASIAASGHEVPL